MPELTFPHRGGYCEKCVWYYLLIKDAPADNVVEVVRCKGCDYYDSLNDYCHMFDFDPPCDSFYCRGATKRSET